MLSLEDGGEPVRTTVYHPFWVLSGRDLTERSAPRELKAHESEGQSLPGRWVNSHELRAGDMIQTRQAAPLRHWDELVGTNQDEFGRRHSGSGLLSPFLKQLRHHQAADQALKTVVVGLGGCCDRVELLEVIEGHHSP